MLRKFKELKVDYENRTISSEIFSKVLQIKVFDSLWKFIQNMKLKTINNISSNQNKKQWSQHNFKKKDAQKLVLIFVIYAMQLLSFNNFYRRIDFYQLNFMTLLLPSMKTSQS